MLIYWQRDEWFRLPCVSANVKLVRAAAPQTDTPIQHISLNSIADAVKNASIEIHKGKSKEDFIRWTRKVIFALRCHFHE